jgi:hypothetical protein
LERLGWEGENSHRVVVQIDDDDGICFNSCSKYVESRILSWFWIGETAGAYLSKTVHKHLSRNNKKYEEYLEIFAERKDFVAISAFVVAFRYPVREFCLQKMQSGCFRNIAYLCRWLSCAPAELSNVFLKHPDWTFCSFNNIYYY